MGIFWTEHGTDGEDDIQGAWHDPVYSEKSIDIVKGGMKITYHKDNDIHFIDLSKYPANSLSDYHVISNAIRGDAPALVLSRDVIGDCELDEVKRFEEMLDKMEIKHFDCIAYITAEMHKHFSKYFEKPCCKAKYNLGLESYIENFKPNSKIYKHFTDKWVIINEQLTLKEAIEYGEKIGILKDSQTCKYIEDSKDGNFATSYLKITKDNVSITYRNYKQNGFLKACGFKGSFESNEITKSRLINFKNHVNGKLFRLDQYWDLFDDIMDVLFDRSFITLMESDPFRKLQQFDYSNKPNLEYIKNTDTQEIIDTFKPIDDLCEALKIDRIPVIPLVKSIKRKIAEGKIKV